MKNALQIAKLSGEPEDSVMLMKSVMVNPQELSDLLDQTREEAFEKTKKGFEDNDIGVQLDTQQCLEVAKYMYEQYEEAMEPPVYAVYTFPDWLNKGLKLLSSKEEK